jgi:type II secretory pathway component PulF
MKLNIRNKIKEKNNFKKIKEIKEKVDRFIYKSLFLKRNRLYIFNYIAQGLKNGSSFKELIESISIGMKKNKYLYDTLTEILEEMETNGLSDMEAMYKVGFITEIELNSISGISKSEPYKAYEFIIKRSKSQSNLKWGVGMLFTPVILVLIGYIIFQPELKALTEELLAPINNLSTKAIEIPQYFNDRSTFIGYLGLVIGIMLILWGWIEYLKRYNQALLFKIFKIYEREFVINNFAVFLSLLKSGTSPIRAIEILSDNKNDILTKKIFENIKKEQEIGRKNLNEVFDDYGMDKATIAYIRSGEDNNALTKSIETALLYNEEKYDKLTKVLTKILPLTGEIIMTIAILIPLIDIINVTTIGTMKFEI